jgi:hypothetical protein
VLPDGEHLLFTALTGLSWDLGVLSLKSGERMGRPSPTIWTPGFSSFSEQVGCLRRLSISRR